MSDRWAITAVRYGKAARRHVPRPGTDAAAGFIPTPDRAGVTTGSVVRLRSARRICEALPGDILIEVIVR
ncbi:MAG: hypothetical protein ACLFVD_05870 [Dehalococcoidia bacterium]